MPACLIIFLVCFPHRGEGRGCRSVSSSPDSLHQQHPNQDVMLGSALKQPIFVRRVVAVNVFYLVRVLCYIAVSGANSSIWLP